MTTCKNSSPTCGKPHLLLARGTHYEVDKRNAGKVMATRKLQQWSGFQAAMALPRKHCWCAVWKSCNFLLNKFCLWCSRLGKFITSSIISITPLNFKSSGCAARGSCRRWKTKADSLLPFQSLLSINVLTKIGPLQIGGWRESKQRETGDSLVDWFLIYFWVEKSPLQKRLCYF